MCDQLELLDLGRKSEGRFPFIVVVDNVGAAMGWQNAIPRRPRRLADMQQRHLALQQRAKLIRIGPRSPIARASDRRNGNPRVGRKPFAQWDAVFKDAKTAGLSAVIGAHLGVCQLRGHSKATDS